MRTACPRLCLLALGCLALNFHDSILAAESELKMTARSRAADPAREGQFILREETKTWDPKKTALVICDMWDKHWCVGATQRVGEMAPRMNEVVSAARKMGVLIIHCPSDTLKYYEGTPQRKLAQDAPKGETKIPLQRWCKIDRTKEGEFPIDDSDGGCSDLPKCKGGPPYPWTRQIDTIKIEDGDAITDSAEAFYLMQQRGLDNLIVMGVHTNMCVLGRPFSIRQMVMQGKNVVVMRDMTDSLYNPAKRPFVNHFTGTDLVIEHIERFWCPSITSVDLIGGREFRFKEDTRPRLAVLMAEDEYKTAETLPEFAKKHLGRDFKVNLVFGNDKQRNDIPGFNALNESDAALISVRRRVLPPEQMEALKKFVAAGKPVIGIRTASHAFALRDNQKLPDGMAAWQHFDKDVLGCNYHDHYPNNTAGNSKTFVWMAPEAAKNPLLAGMKADEIPVTASLYKSLPLEEGTSILMMGRYADSKPAEPVAWTFKRKDGGKTFYTSLGHPDEFKQPFFTRLLLNGIYWAAGLAPPATEAVPETPPEKNKSTDTPPAPDKTKATQTTPAPTPAQAGAKGLDQALQKLHAPLAGGDPLSAAESLAKMKPAAGLAVDLIASEPAVRQPLNITFDERGRMWVAQYIQYPFPAGLKIVEYDQYIRAKFDKVPLPPPKHVPGADKITIFEDTKGDGSFASSKDFVKDLNIATSALPGRGGVWVMNPPYLLFYPDANRDDIPDGDPVVHLSGFGLEDTHAVANSLTWGPDGWLYGAQGSTCTAKVKAELSGETKTTDFLGQAIWRYHTETHRFEIFAEGGGNTFGVEFDDKGRVYSGTNWGAVRGLHFVQGGYYVKGWGKHGPLTNPYAFGFFNHMPHTGNGDRLTHTFVVYGGGALPEQYNGKLIGPSALQKRIQVTRLEPFGSTFKTVEEPFLLTSSDGWFRPVDLKTGPDGALYIADMYENRISHVDPRDNWDRGNGRLYRVRSEKYTPAVSRDFSKLSSVELIECLKDKNRWARQTALRIFGDRKDASVIPQLRELVEKKTGQLALEALWALNLCGGFDDKFALKALKHADPFVRMWAVRLLGDPRVVSHEAGETLWCDFGTANGTSVEVRGQLASTAKRIAGETGRLILPRLFLHDEDMNDPYIPLLLWWAVEVRAESEREDLIKMLSASIAGIEIWKRPLVKDFILERLIQRYAAAGGAENLESCAKLLTISETKGESAKLLSGLEKAFSGRSIGGIPANLKTAIETAFKNGGAGSNILLGLRIGQPEALDQALKLIADEKADKEKRLSVIRTLGEISQPRSIPVFLNLLTSAAPPAVKNEALNSLQRYDDPQIGAAVLQLYPEKLPEENGIRAGALNLLASRPSSANQFLEAIDAGKIKARGVPLELVRKLALHPDEKITKLIEKHWGRVQAASPAEKIAEIDRTVAMVSKGKGDAAAGKTLYTASCAKCHTLFGEGGKVGPELTGYERDKAAFWAENIIDPNAAIREEFTQFIIKTRDGRILTGVVAEQQARTVTLATPEGQHMQLDRDQIEKMKASPMSLMPEDLLKPLSEQQVRDLFAYLMSKGK